MMIWLLLKKEGYDPLVSMVIGPITRTTCPDRKTTPNLFGLKHQIIAVYPLQHTFL
jgi:hypothetical protein